MARIANCSLRETGLHVIIEFSTNLDIATLTTKEAIASNSSWISSVHMIEQWGRTHQTEPNTCRQGRALARGCPAGRALMSNLGCPRGRALMSNPHLRAHACALHLHMAEQWGVLAEHPSLPPDGAESLCLDDNRGGAAGHEGHGMSGTGLAEALQAMIIEDLRSTHRITDCWLKLDGFGERIGGVGAAAPLGPNALPRDLSACGLRLALACNAFPIGQEAGAVQCWLAGLCPARTCLHSNGNCNVFSFHNVINIGNNNVFSFNNEINGGDAEVSVRETRARTTDRSCKTLLRTLCKSHDSWAKAWSQNIN